MRTTIEISYEQHAALTALAIDRGLRGISPIVREAIDAYLVSDRGRLREALLDLRGTLSHESADRIEQIVAERGAGEWRRSIETFPGEERTR
jgi:Ribbon-helix-helix protein, copG family